MAGGEYGIPAGRSDRRTGQESRFKFESRSGAVSAGPGLHRRTQSGAVAANRRRHRQRQRPIPVSAGSLNAELRDWSAALNADILTGAMSQCMKRGSKKNQASSFTTRRGLLLSLY